MLAVAIFVDLLVQWLVRPNIRELPDVNEIDNSHHLPNLQYLSRYNIVAVGQGRGEGFVSAVVLQAAAAFAGFVQVYRFVPV